MEFYLGKYICTHIYTTHIFGNISILRNLIPEIFNQERYLKHFTVVRDYMHIFT